MSQVNFSESVDPDDVPHIHENPLEQEEAEMVDDVEDDGDYDILPSNGNGLSGDDGEQVVEEGETDEDE